MDEKERALTELEKRYKRYRWTQWILFAVSIIAAVAPATIVTIRVGLRYKSAESGWSLAGFSIVIFGLGLALIMRGLFRKFADKIPWAMGAVVGSWILVLLLWSLQAIIEDALNIALALAIGSSVAIIVATISDFYKAQADGLEAEYKRRQA